MGIEVYVPCPISTLCMIRVTCPSRPMRTKALGAKVPASAALASVSVGRWTLSSSPPPAAAPAAKNARREREASREDPVTLLAAGTSNRSEHMFNLSILRSRRTAQPA
jgi:hypothetical protein